MRCRVVFALSALRAESHARDPLQMLAHTSGAAPQRPPPAAPNHAVNAEGPRTNPPPRPTTRCDP